MGLANLLFSFNGRINRAQYWMGSLGLGAAVGVFVGFYVAMTVSSPMETKAAGAGAAIGFFLMLGAVWLFTSWCAMAIQVKRFHDRGQSGYWSLLPMLPALGMFMSVAGAIASNQDMMQAMTAVQPYVFVSWIINIGLFINLGCLPGTDGPNKYGDGPGSTAPGAPSPAPKRAPGVNAPASSPASAIFGNAEKAMERAIAERSAPQPAAAASRPQGAPRPAMAAAAPAPAAAAPGKPASFGRRVAR